MKEILLAIALAVGIMPSWACEPPQVNTEGLVTVEVIQQPTTPKNATHGLQAAIDVQDAIALTKMLWGEARGCTYDDKRNCCITAINRAADVRFPDTVYECIVQPYQYLGYAASNPVDAELYEIAVEALTDYELHKQGIKVGWKDYNAFWGDGVQNHFYTV